MRKLAALLAVVALLMLAACGGSRPSTSEVSKAFTENSEAFFGSAAPFDAMPKDMADCMADVLVKSDLSDEALQALVDGDQDFDGSEADEKALEKTSPAIMECASNHLDLDGLGEDE